MKAVVLNEAFDTMEASHAKLVKDLNKDLRQCKEASKIRDKTEESLSLFMCALTIVVLTLAGHGGIELYKDISQWWSPKEEPAQVTINPY